MSSRILLRKSLKSLYNLDQRAPFASAASANLKKSQQQGPLLIECKRPILNYHLGMRFDKLEEVPLASKGWNHNKSKSDCFTVLPLPEEYPEEFHAFEELDVNPQIIEALRRIGIKTATLFQSTAIPTIYKGSHTLLAAETGCGKTIAYLVPLIQKLAQKGKNMELNTPRVVVLVPSRELAYQVADAALSLCDPVGLHVKTLVGGKIKQTMLNPTFSDVDVLVATPGALSKLSTVGIFKLGEVSALVLDEADTLMDDSFVERMETLVKRMSQAQLIMVSATLPRKLPDILEPYGETMKHVTSPRLHKPLLNIHQKFMRITRSVKPANLLQIAKHNKDPFLVFTNRNQTCKWLAMFLRENGVSCSNISGDMNFAIRIEQWNQFVRGETNILSATDVGSRGLNTIQVKHVLNYDFPLYVADYIHRIGRVGRLGSPQQCKVTNFITSPEEIKLVQQIELSIRKNQPLNNVDGNITHIVKNKILKKMREGS